MNPPWQTSYLVQKLPTLREWTSRWTHQWKKVINVHIKDGIIIHFKSCAEGFFYTNLDESSMITNPNNASVNVYSYLSALKQNFIFTNSEVEGAWKVRKLQQHIYWLGKSNFKTYIHEGMVINCPLNPEYSVRADHIYGPARPLLKIGMEHRRNSSGKVPIVPLPMDILLHHKNIKPSVYCLWYIMFMHHKVYLNKSNNFSRIIKVPWGCG